ncbi:MAG: N-acetylmuramoyl-L-alanine amidase, partial [Candidatus Bathyarchaeia archaeon]
ELATQLSGGTITNLPDTSNPIWNVVYASIPESDKWGGWVSLVCPMDNHADLYKNHQPKPAIPKNSDKRPLYAGIVIDAGHGGKNDIGCVGTTYGTIEKSINLPRAQELENVLSNHKSYQYAHTNPSQRLINYWVKLTREADVYISLTKRAKIAMRFWDKCKERIERLQKENKGIWWLGMAFVALHHNSPEDHKRTIVYRRDNEGGSGILSEKVLTQVKQIQTNQPREYRTESTTERMDLIKHLREEGWGFPAILIEIAYLSSPYDEALATGRGEGIDKDFPSNFVIRTHRGIDDFFVPQPIPGYGPGL